MRWAFLLLWLALWLSSSLASPTEPPSGAPLHYQLPRPERTTLPNGVVIYTLEDRDLPLVDIEMRLRGGSIYDPAEKVGLHAVLAAAWRNGGTRSRSPEAFNTAIEDMAALLGVEDHDDTIAIRLSALARDWRRALRLAVELLRYPAFHPSRVELAKAQLVEQIRRRNDDLGGIASREFAGLVYGVQHLLGRLPTLQSTQRILRDDLLHWHRRLVTPRNLWIAVVGDVDSRLVLTELRRLLGDWQGSTPSLPDVASPEGISAVTAFVEKPAEQAHIRVGHLGVPRGVPERAALDVLNYILGGSFTSRLTAEIRDRRGLAYSVWSSFTPAYPCGLFEMGCQTAAETAEEVVQLLLQQARRLTEEAPSEEEVQQAKESLANSFVFRFPTSTSAVVARMLLEIHHLPPDTYDTYLQRVQAVTAQDILQVARKYIRPDRLVVLVVGDSGKLSGLAAKAKRVTAR